jgi:hypothetical protein
LTVSGIWVDGWVDRASSIEGVYRMGPVTCDLWPEAWIQQVRCDSKSGTPQALAGWVGRRARVVARYTDRQ